MIFIKNEYIKSSIDVFLPVYSKLFNCIFDSGIIPESWLTGNVKITFSFLILTIQKRHIEQKYYQLSNNPS
jgi:hypothetical protein